MILFGLFHGLILLPVLLSICGSAPHLTKDSDVIEDIPEVKELKEVMIKKTEKEDINTPS